MLDACKIPGGRALAACLAAVIFFSAMASGGHDLWAATVVYLGTLTLGAAVFILCSWRSDSPGFSAAGAPALLGLGAALALSCIFSVHPNESIVAFMDWLSSITAFFIALNLFGSSSSAPKFLAFLAPAIWIELAVNLFQRWEGYHIPFVALAGTLVNANIATAFLIGWVAPFEQMAVEERNIYWKGTFLILLLTIALFISVWAAFCLLAAVPFFIGIEKCRRWMTANRRQCVMVAAFLTLALAATLVWKFHHYQEIGREAGISRILWWMSGLKMFWDHPWLGIGLGNYPSAYLSYKVGGGQNTLYIHSFPLEILAETGITGLIAAGVFLAWLLKQARLPKVRHSFLLGAALMAAYCSINVGMEYLTNLLVFWIFLGIALAPAMETKRRRFGFPTMIIVSAMILAAFPYVVSPFLASRDCVTGWERINAKDFQGAKKTFLSASHIDRLSSEAQRGMARSCAELYRTDGQTAMLAEAIDHQEKAISLDRRNGGLFQELGTYWLMAGKKPEAQQAFKQAAAFGKH